MSISSFAELANTTLADAKPLPLLPEGIYRGKIVGMWKEHKSANNLAAEYPLRITAPGDDIDLEALQAAGGIPDKSYPYRFWMSENARFMFGNFARSCGYSDDLGLMESLNMIGTDMPDVLVEYKHEDMQDKQGKPLVDDSTGEIRKRGVWTNIVAAA